MLVGGFLCAMFTNRKQFILATPTRRFGRKFIHLRIYVYSCIAHAPKFLLLINDVYVCFFCFVEYALELEVHASFLRSGSLVARRYSMALQ